VSGGSSSSADSYKHRSLPPVSPMANTFINGPMAPTATANFPIGGLNWVPGGIKKTGPGANIKRRALVTGVPPYTDEQGMRDNLPNGRVHITKAVDLSGREFTSDHLGLGELLFEHSSETDLPFGTQQSRIVTYSELNTRLGRDIRRYSTPRAGGAPTCNQLCDYAKRRARLWAFIGVQPTDHVSMARGRDSVHIAVAASHKCNAVNVFLADNVACAGDRLYLQIKEPDDLIQSLNCNSADPRVKEYVDSLGTACLTPFVSKHRQTPPNPFYIYVGRVSFMYGTQFDPRDPFRLQSAAMRAISAVSRDEQLKMLRAMPTVDIFLLRP